jgi:peroxiredoxin
MMTTLKEELNAFQDQFNKMASEAATAFADMINDLKDKGIGKGLEVGAKAPDFTLEDATGKTVTLTEKLANGPVILVFYRGEWCPFCNLQLNAYQSIIEDIKDSGAELIAISPQTPDHSLTMKEKNELSFSVLSDVGNKVAESYNLKFSMPEYFRDIHKGLGVNLDEFNGNTSWELPVPATYVINKEGIIVAGVSDPDYRTRMEPTEVLNVIRSLNK